MEHSGNEIVVWDWETKEILQVEELDAAPLEVRWMHGPDGLGGFTNAAFGNSIWYWGDDDDDGRLKFHKVMPEDRPKSGSEHPKLHPPAWQPNDGPRNSRNGAWGPPPQHGPCTGRPGYEAPMTTPSAARSLADGPPPDSATSAPNLREFVFAGFRLLEARHAPGQRLEAHAHDRATLLISLGPEFEERIEGSPIAVQCLDVVWKPGGATHENHYPRGARSFVVEFTRDFWSDRDEQLRRDPWAGRGLPAAILLALRDRVFSSSDSLGVELDELLTCSLDQIRSARAEAVPAPERVARVRDRLRSTVAAPPRLGELAAEVELHPSHLCRLFRRQFGCSMGEYVRRVRIRRALDLLRRQPRSSLSGIAFDLGYADQPHFTRNFRRLVGVPPGRYRSMVRRVGRKDRSIRQD